MLARILSVVVAVGLVACAASDASKDETSAPSDSAATSPKGSTADDSPDTSAPSDGGTTSTGVVDPKVHSIANLGDSISQGFDADDSNPIDLGQVKSDPTVIFHDNPTLSWIQGTDARIGSVRQHFLSLDPTLVVTPLSRSGSELVKDLVNQANQIGKRGVTPDMVYVLIGGNDICNRAKSTTADATANLYPVSQWTTQADAALDALVANLPAGATVRFLSMPRVDLLYTTLNAARVPIMIDSPVGPVTGSTTCKDLWSLTAQQANGICEIVTTEGDDTRRAAIGQRVDDYNDALAAEVRKYDTDTTKNPKGVHFQSEWHGSLNSGAATNSSVGTYKFTADEVSHLDCFHPSILGQQHIADHVLHVSNWAAN